MSDGTMDIFTKIVEDAQNKRKRKIENYINAVVESLAQDIRAGLLVKALGADPEIMPELETWVESHKHDFAFSLSETARVVLIKELLKEEVSE